MGRQIQEVTIGYEIDERTDWKLALAWIGLPQAVPMLACLIPAGHVADRMGRRLIIVRARLAHRVGGADERREEGRGGRAISPRRFYENIAA